MFKERSRRQRLRRQKRQNRTILLVCAFIILAIIISVSACNGLSEGSGEGDGTNAAASHDGASAQDETDVPGASDPGGLNALNDEEEKKGIEALWYYEPERADRYAVFAAENPELTEDEAVWMVGCDLDKVPYEDISPVPDPDSILLLVNKYYYLPRDYVPDDLISVGKTQMRREAGEAMLEMISDAASGKMKLWSQSGFRGYDLQSRLYNDYVSNQGPEAADRSSARPGHSEHQTGLTTDLNTITEAFGRTEEGLWVAEHCHEYGFIVRYNSDTQDVTLFKYEPWHMRYIGRDAAAVMQREGIATFEEYWVKYVKHKPPG